MEVECHPHRGGISPIVVLACVSMIVVTGLFYVALGLQPADGTDAEQTTNIQVYCASGVAQPVEQALEMYCQSRGVQARVVRTGGSGRLFGQIETETRIGVACGADLYVTADSSLLQHGRQQGIIGEILPLAKQRPVVAIHTDSSISDMGLENLLSDGTIRCGIANENAAIGRLVRALAARDGFLEELFMRRKVEAENVMQLAQALRIRSIDVAILWDTTVTQVNRQNGKKVLKILTRLDAPTGEPSGSVAVGVVKGTTSRIAAIRVARYLAARDGGLPLLDEAGFEVIDGDHGVGAAEDLPCPMSRPDGGSRESD